MTRARGTSPYFFLRNDEAVLSKVGPARGFAFSLFVIAFILASILVTAALIGMIAAKAPSFVFAIISVAYLVLLTAGALFAWRRWATSEYVITDARIYARTGRLITRVHFTTHDKVTDIHYKRGVFDRIFGTSSIQFATAGGNVHMTGLADALAMKERAEDAREVFIKTLLDDAARRAPPEARAPFAESAARPGAAGDTSDGDVPTAGAPMVAEEVMPMTPWTGPTPDYMKKGDVPVWFGKPTLASALGAVLPLAAFIIFFGFAGPVGLIALPFVLLGAAALLGVTALQLHNIEYLVSANRVYARSGILGTTVKQLTFDKITDITYNQDILGRIIGYGALTLDTAGSSEAPVKMLGLREPLVVKELVEAARSRYLREVDA